MCFSKQLWSDGELSAQNNRPINTSNFTSLRITNLSATTKIYVL